MKKRKTKKAKAPPPTVHFRPGELSVTELYHEANELGIGLSSYLRKLITVGRKEAKRVRKEAERVQGKSRGLSTVWELFNE